MVALTALGAAVLIGIGDFFGSLAARQGRILAATLWVMILAAIPTVVVAVIVGGSPRPVDYWLGGLAGLAGGAGLLMLYAGYAKTSIGIVGPVTAVTGVILPVAVGIAIGDKVGGAVVLGIGIGILAIVLIGWKPETGGRHTASAAVLYGVGAGAAFRDHGDNVGTHPRERRIVASHSHTCLQRLASGRDSYDQETSRDAHADIVACNSAGGDWFGWWCPLVHGCRTAESRYLGAATPDGLWSEHAARHRLSG